MLKNEDFLNVEKYLEDDYWCTCIISERGLGKTHSSVKMVDKDLTENGGKCVFTRITYEPFKKFKDDIGSMTGWGCSVHAQNIKKDNETIGYLTSLNTYANAKGGTYNDVRWMIFDEFNEDEHIENAFAKFCMLVDSFKRHRKDFKCILLGNMINKNNWFLNAMGLRIDWKSQEDVIHYLPDFGVKVVVVGSQTYNNIKRARQDITKLASADPTAHAFYNEQEFLNDDGTNVVNFKIWVEKTFKPSFFFAYKEFKYMFGSYTETDGLTTYFVDRNNGWFRQWDGKIPEFSFDGEGALIAPSSLALEEDDIEELQTQFYVLAKQKRLVFGSFDAFDDLVLFIGKGMLNAQK